MMRVIQHRYPGTPLSALSAAVLSAALFAPPAFAQDGDGGALRFLKPWIEKQLFGRETSGPEAAPAAPTMTPTPPANTAPATGEAAPDQTLPAAAAPDAAAIGDETAPASG